MPGLTRGGPDAGCRRSRGDARPVSGWPRPRCRRRCGYRRPCSARSRRRAKPLTAAIVGMGSVSMARKTSLPCLPRLAALFGQGAHLADVGAGHSLFTAAGDDQSADIRVRLYSLETSSSRSVRTSEFSAFSALGQVMVATAIGPSFPAECWSCQVPHMVHFPWAQRPETAQGRQVGIRLLIHITL